MTFTELRAIVRMNGGDARVFTFDGGQTVYVTGLGLTADESASTAYWGDAVTAVERMAARLAKKGLDMYGMAS